MARVLDIATMQFVPTNYTRNPQGSENERALAAHLRGISDGFGVQAGVNAGVSAAADKNDQYAYGIRTVNAAGVLISSASSDKLQVLNGGGGAGAFEESRDNSGTDWAASGFGSVIEIPDIGLWKWTGAVSFDSSSSGITWDFWVTINGVQIGAKQPEAIAVTSEPNVISIVGMGRVNLVDGAQNAWELRASPSSGSQTIIVQRSNFVWEWRDN